MTTARDLKSVSDMRIARSCTKENSLDFPRLRCLNCDNKNDESENDRDTAQREIGTHHWTRPGVDRKVIEREGRKRVLRRELESRIAIRRKMT